MNKARTADMTWLRLPALVRAVAALLDTVGGFDLSDPEGSCLALGVHPAERAQFLELVGAASSVRKETGNAARCRRSRAKKKEEEARKTMSPPMSEPASPTVSQGMSGTVSETMSIGMSPSIRPAPSPFFHSVSGSSSSPISAENTFQTAGSGAVKIPPNLRLTDEARDAALMIGMRVEDVSLEWAKFVAHYVETGEVSGNWYARWQKWVPRAIQFSRSENGGKGRPPVPHDVQRGEGDKRFGFIGARADEGEAAQ